jgi:polysaccharide biosynthesis transport protein
MRSQRAASPDDIDLTAVGAAVKRAMRKLFIAAVLAGAACLGILSQLTPKYASQAQIEIIAKNPFEPRRDLSAPEMVSVRLDKEAIGTHVRALQSTDLALKVARELDLASKPEFNSALIKRGPVSEILRLAGLVGPRAGETEEDRVLAAYGEALRVYQIKETRGIMVDFRSWEPRLAAEAANKVAELYRDDLALRTVGETNDARAKLGPQILKLAAEVAEAEAQVTRFRGEANIFDGGRERTGLNEQQLAELTGEQTKAATSRAESEARARAAREMMVRNGGESLPDVQKSALVPRLVEQRVRVERQLAELSATLLPAHPRMKQLNAELHGLNRQIRVEVEKIVDGLEREAKVAALREEGIAGRIDEAKRRVVSAGGNDVKLRALDSVAKAKRAELERLQAQLESARTTSDARAVPFEVQIVSRARPSSEQAWPKLGLTTALTMLATLLLGLAWVVTRELIAAARTGNAGRLTATDLSALYPRSMRLPAAGRQPAASPGFVKLATIPALARQLVDHAQGRAGHRTMIAGASDAGTSGAIAVKLARQLADMGKQVILLDVSQDGQGFAGQLGLAPTLGVSDVLAGGATFEDVVKRLPNSEAHVIVAGSGAAGAAAAHDTDRVNMLLDALDDAYQHVLLAGSYDALRGLFATIAGRIDCGILIAERDATSPPGTFLGFDVPDLDVISYRPIAPSQRGEAVLRASEGAVV